MIAAVRPDSWNFPLFLHVLGATLLFGAILSAAILSLVAWRRPDARALGRATFFTLLIAALPAWVLMRAGAAWIYSKEGFSGNNDPTWIGVGFIATEPGLLVILVATGVAFWWRRSNKPVAGHIVAVLSSLYVILLGVAWLAMSGKWG